MEEFSKSTVFVPDFFLLFFYITLFCSSLCLDILILFHLIFTKNLLTIIIFALSVFLHSLFELTLERINQNESPFGFLPAFSQVAIIIFYLVGFGAILVTLKALKETVQNYHNKTKPLPDNLPYPFFHIPNESLTVIKMYCFITVVLKCIPQFFILSIFILEGYVTGIYVFLLAANIKLNIVIFSQTMATTFPFRRFPKIFISSPSIVFNGLNKFMATMCACCVNLVIFVMAFKSVRYYAILVVLSKTLLWVWPTFQAMRAQQIPYCKFISAIFFIFINVIFGFIYIHPFERLGTLHYYFFYCLGLIYEILVIYILTAAELEFVSCYLLLKVLMFGFLSCFGVLNIFQIFQEDKKPPKRGSSTGPTDSKADVNKNPQLEIETAESVEAKYTRGIPKTNENKSRTMIGDSRSKPSTTEKSMVSETKVARR